MDLRRHGGGCCGVYHISGFPTGRNAKWSENARSRFATFLKTGVDDNAGGKCLEVVLTDRQTECEETKKHLKEAGFRLVTRFKNSSGNWCNIFHAVNGKVDGVKQKNSKLRSPWYEKTVNRRLFRG